MLNHLVLIGKVIEILKEESKVIIEVPKSYKNVDGIYETRKRYIRRYR